MSRWRGAALWGAAGILALPLAPLAFNWLIAPLYPGLRAFSAVPLSALAGRPTHVSFAARYRRHCAHCHGDSLEGGTASPLVGRELASAAGADEIGGEFVERVAALIASGMPGQGMPALRDTLDAAEIRSIAIYVAERRQRLGYSDARGVRRIDLPAGPVETQAGRFRIETLAAGLGYAYSIAPLPDGSILLTEKTGGLSVVGPDGARSVIAGTPRTARRGLSLLGSYHGVGWLLDVAPHPEYPDNGWIYLAHTHLCGDCGGAFPRSMVRLLRGRIRDGEWRDEQVLWRSPAEYYTADTDTAAGGRIAFDGAGMVYFTVGAKATGGFLDLSFSSRVQELGTPYGKVHRIRDDGRIPADNPFAARAGAMPSTWTWGHRAPQGLEFDGATGRLWSSEMGPRGGDELNLLKAGANYGWPRHSLGIGYDGREVAERRATGAARAASGSEPPLIDLTPSPAASSFVVYRGGAFPGWRGDIIMGTLKAARLYRFVIEDGRHVHSEVLLRDLARIRDIETGPDGLLYLLLEHGSGSRIVRLAPAGA